MRQKKNFILTNLKLSRVEFELFRNRRTLRSLSHYFVDESKGVRLLVKFANVSSFYKMLGEENNSFTIKLTWASSFLSLLLSSLLRGARTLIVRFFESYIVVFVERET